MKGASRVKGNQELMIAVLFLNLVLAGCSTVRQVRAREQHAAGERVPKSLANAGECGESVYDYAKSSNWKSTDAILVALKEAVKQVRADVEDQSAGKDRLDGNVAALDRAVTTKNQQAAMHEANQVTFDVADMTLAYRLSVPVEVTRLDYYGRELEIWAEAGDADKLHATVRGIQREWDALRLSVEAHDAIEAKTFGALVAQIEAVKTPADYARLATSVLDEVDNLEQVFQR